MSKIFILHGWTYYGLETWKPLCEMLAARGLDSELLKIPGLTDGTNPVWTLDDYVKWLEGQTASCEKVILIGHSNGGRISLAFAAQYPEKVERLVLIASAGIPPRGMRRWKRDIFKKLANIGHLFVRSEHLRTLVYKVIRESDYRRATPEMRKTMSSLLSVDLSLVLDKIHAPTLLIWGANDTTTPLVDGELMHEGIRGSKMVVLPDARHNPHITHTEVLTELITEELRS